MDRQTLIQSLSNINCGLYETHRRAGMFTHICINEGVSMDVLRLMFNHVVQEGLHLHEYLARYPERVDPVVMELSSYLVTGDIRMERGISTDMRETINGIVDAQYKLSLEACLTL